MTWCPVGYILLYCHKGSKEGHDEFTKKVKDKVTILGIIFCSDKSPETFENVQKATKALQKLQNGSGKFLSLAGKILGLQHSMEQRVKYSHFKKFMCKIERYLYLYKGNEIMEKVSTGRDRGGLGLINIKERIQAMQVLEYLQADQKITETSNALFNVGLHQKHCTGQWLSKEPTLLKQKKLSNYSQKISIKSNNT